MRILPLALFAFLAFTFCTVAQQTPPVSVEATEPVAEAVAEPPAAPAAPKVVVLIPEQIDAEWYWYYYSDTRQHLTQTAVEKALVRAGFDVIDLASLQRLQDQGSINSIATTESATSIGREAGADYAVVGTATAVKSSEGSAYGVTAIRSQAEITAKIIRISDGKVVAVEDASALVGGQAPRAAGQNAIKKAADDIGRKLARALGTVGK